MPLLHYIIILMWQFILHRVIAHYQYLLPTKIYKNCYNKNNMQLFKAKQNWNKLGKNHLIAQIANTAK